ncbi:hypothetical protein F4781DRAFT_306917 [Annulohypoxylon bovei var. microspora]|nr:hypothetical protein F4781DRAFT_306917 [Annulohypoxylon bovei var. microspora]
MNFSKGPCSLWLPHWRFVIPAFMLTVSFYILLGNLWQDQQPHVTSQDDYHSKVDVDKGHSTSAPNYDGSDITINLVVATLSKDDISWTQNIQIPNLKVIRYVSDNLKAEFHPPVPNKGREALIYHTYMHDFYDNLPDISIFTHADESPWHVEGTLNSSLVFALSHLDLNEVLQRHYFNLRVSWENACPNWINTSKTDEDWNKQEEPYMYEAFTENFATNDVPEILGGPCCSQFAATRDVVRRHPKSQYRINMEWLMQTHWDDYISGRVWEHMWPWLFVGKAVDCEVEWKAYCKMYHICFDPQSRTRLINLKEEKKELERKTGLLEGLLDLLRGFEVRRRLKEINAILAEELEKAVERGKDEAVRMKLLSDFNL